jgi:hypothetical protein
MDLTGSRSSLLARLARPLQPLPHDLLTLERDVREGRFQRSLALIAALSSLMSGFQVTTEHYRAGYGLQVMFTPVILSPLLSVAGALAAVNRRAARTLLPVLSFLTFVDGLVGVYFHARNIARRPAGWRLPVVNVVMGAPLLAPALFALSGYLGLIASLLRREGGGIGEPPIPRWLTRVPHLGAHTLEFETDVREGRFQQHLAAAAGLTALLSAIESLYSHYRNDYRYAVEWTPFALGLLMAAVGFATVTSRTVARLLLLPASLLAVLDGAAGFYYHVRGVLRRPGGADYLSYNVLYGPPLFAPLLVAASGFMGLVAALLRRA